VIDNEHLKVLYKICENLPPLSFGFFEFWFGESTNRVDFNISINGWLGEHKLAYNYFIHNRINSGWEHEPHLAPITKFLHQWTQPGFAHNIYIKQLWLAFDVKTPKEQVYTPWFYIHFTYIPILWRIADRKQIILDTLFNIEAPYTFQFKKNLSRFFEKLPQSIFVSSIGIQTKRNIGSLRVYLVIPTYKKLFYFLKQFQWPGNLDALNKDLNGMENGCSLFGLCIDLGPALQPEIGIEFWYSTETSLERLQNLTEKLIDLKICTPKKADAFLKWNGEFLAENNTNISTRLSSTQSVLHTSQKKNNKKESTVY
jgi:hypothetical protein